MSWEIAVILSLTSIAAMFVVLSINSKKHGALQLYFLIFSLFVMIAQLNTAIKITDSVAETSVGDTIIPIYWGMEITIVFVISYFLVVFVITHLKQLEKRPAGDY